MKDNTDPAFPCPDASKTDFGHATAYTGVTKLDYFAIRIFHKLMDRHPENGYVEQEAMATAWRMANDFIAMKNQVAASDEMRGGYCED